jgi:glycosyltransferase involved in cell wall biosynthesis
VLHVFKYFRPRFTGEGIFVERLAPVFGALRPDVMHEIAVTATARPNDITLPEGLNAIHYLANGDREASQKTLVSWLARNAHHYQAVHYHTHVDRTFAASIWLRLAGVRVLLSATLDDSVPGILKTYRPLFRPLVRRLMRSIEHFIAISTRLFDENRRFVAEKKNEMLPIGISIPQILPNTRRGSREKLGLSPAATVLVSVGGICPRKSQLFLVQQLPALVRKYPDLLLILVGPVLDPQYKAEIDSFIFDQELEGHVLFPGYCETPWDFYGAADMMVFASEQEGFGTVMIEAMAYGLPVVARHLPGVNDMFVTHGTSGYLFTQAEQFQNYVSELIDSPALSREMGAAGRAFAINHYDISSIAARYLALYGFPPVRAAA